MIRVALGILATLFLFSSMLALTRVQTAPAAPPKGAIEGTVLDSATGQPIQGVQVLIIPGQPPTNQSILGNQKPTEQSPQVTKSIPAASFGNQTVFPERTAYAVLTDYRGRFAFTGIVAAAYSLSLQADGYHYQIYGEKPGYYSWLPIDIRDTKTDLGVLRMNPEGQISGTVVDLDGHQVSGMTVYLVNAQPTLGVDADKQFRVEGTMMTDERGHYTFQQIAVGHYYIAAGGFGRPAGINRVSGPTTPGGGNITQRLPALQPQPFTYYPGVSDVGLSWQIDVAGGSKVELKDLILIKPVLREIRGRVVDSTSGKPPQSVRVTLTGMSPFTGGGMAPPTEILSNVKYDETTGLFQATNLIPASYRIDATPPQQPSNSRVGGAPSQSAIEILELRDTDIQDLVLAVPARGRVTGKVLVSDGKPFPVSKTNLSIPFQLMFRPFSPLQPAPVVTSVSVVDGTFEVGTTLEGKYRFYLTPLQDNYYVSEAQLNGVPATNGVLEFPKSAITELVISLAPGGEIQGSVVDKKGLPVKQAQGLLLPYPVPDIIPFYRSITANGTGGFIVDGVPPGAYKLYFWEGIDPSQFLDRELLGRSGEKGAIVRVEKASRATVSVPIIVP